MTYIRTLEDTDYTITVDGKRLSENERMKLLRDDEANCDDTVYLVHLVRLVEEAQRKATTYAITATHADSLRDDGSVEDVGQLREVML